MILSFFLSNQISGLIFAVLLDRLGFARKKACSSLRGFHLRKQCPLRRRRQRLGASLACGSSIVGGTWFFTSAHRCCWCRCSSQHRASGLRRIFIFSSPPLEQWDTICRE